MLYYGLEGQTLKKATFKRLQILYTIKYFVVFLGRKRCEVLRISGAKGEGDLGDVNTSKMFFLNSNFMFSIYKIQCNSVVPFIFNIYLFGIFSDMIYLFVNITVMGITGLHNLKIVEKRCFLLCMTHLSPKKSYSCATATNNAKEDGQIV